MCFGALVFKPHLGVLIPVLLIASGRWTTILTAACTAGALLLASVSIFGLETWQGFLHGLPLAQKTLEYGLVDPAKMQSIFAGIRLLHADISTAYAVQIACAIIAAALLVLLVQSKPANHASGPALVAATFLASPFVLDYDLTILAIPLAWTFAETRRTGFLPWEKTVLLAAFVLPALSRLAGLRMGIPIGPPVVLGLFLIVLRRGFLSAEKAHCLSFFSQRFRIAGSGR